MNRHWSLLIGRILIAVLLLASAAQGLSEMDTMEVDVYAALPFDFNTAAIIGRLLIAFEFLLGGLLLTGFYMRRSLGVSAIYLIVSSALILFHTVGLSDLASVLPIAQFDLAEWLTSLMTFVLGALALVAIRHSLVSTLRPYRRLALAVLLVASVALPIIISLPDFFRKEKYSASVDYDTVLLQEYLAEVQLDTGRRMVAFYGSGCRFCKLASRKISVIDERTKTTPIDLVFWGSEEGIERFRQQYDAAEYPMTTIDSERFLAITKGRMPLILLLNEGEVVGRYNYRSLDDLEVMRFLDSSD